LFRIEADHGGRVDDVLPLLLGGGPGLEVAQRLAGDLDGGLAGLFGWRWMTRPVPTYR
jgi:hypothetical protein